MKNIDKPSCFKSNPSYQAQAENGCDDCKFQIECFDNVKTIERDLLSEALEWWKNMDDDEIEEFEELPPYMQNSIKRLVFYADKYAERRTKDEL